MAEYKDGLKKWAKDAEYLAEEVLDDPDLELLRQYPKRGAVYRAVGTVGRSVYRKMSDWQDQHPEADYMLARDYSQEAMTAELKRKLDELFPNREQEREEAAWEAHLRRMEEEEAEDLL